MGYSVEDLFEDLIQDLASDGLCHNFVHRFGNTTSEKKWLLVRMLVMDGYDNFEEGLREFLYSTYGGGYDSCLLIGTTGRITNMIGDLPPDCTITYKGKDL